MILMFVWVLGLLILLSRGVSVLSFFISLEIMFFMFIFFFGSGGSDMSFLWSLILAIGASVLMLTFLVSTMIFYGSDSQSTFLD